MNDAFPFRGAVETGKAIARGKLSSLAATRAMLARIKQVDSATKSYVILMEDNALAEAKRADHEAASGKHRGPLHGVPLAVKDLCDAVGYPTTGGIPMFAEHKATMDSTVVARLRTAGAVILGKLKLTEGAMALHHPDVEPPVNPWNGELWTGVSSSGSGVAVAAGLCFGALGSDTGGSIRFPSQANRIVGLKPTWGRVSRAGVFPLAETLDHVGPMTRRVEDAAAMLGAIAGHDARDATSSAEPVTDYLKAVGRGVKGFRLGIDRAYATEGVAPEIVAAVKRTLAVLKRAGATVFEVTMPPVQDALASWLRIASAEAAMGHAATYPARKDGYGPYFAELLENGRRLPAADYAACAVTRRALRAGMDALFRDIDLMITPVTPMLSPTNDQIAFRAGQVDPENRFLRFTAPTDITGFPTITLPAGSAANGAGIGVQLVARPFEETLLFRAGKVWQDAEDWAGTVPPLARES
jgi:amidase